VPSFVQSLLALPARTKGVLAVSTVAVLGVAFLLLRVAGAPSYQILSSGLDPAQTGKVTAALDAQGIGYELRNNGTALAVDKSQVGAARVALATGGVSLAGGQDGFDLFDKQKLGASQFQQQVTYQRALEGEIANTINGVAGVSNAQVQLVLPKDDLFADTATPATAAVMLGNPVDSLQPGAVSGIAQLVASSVQGLKADKVTITDSTGQLLWPAGDAAGGAADGIGAGATKQAAEARFDSAMEAKLNAMLAQTLGPGKAQVQVNADLDVDRTTLHTLTYTKKGVPEEVTTDKEKLNGGGGAAGGSAGTASNIPAYSAPGGAGGANSKYQHTVKTQKNALGKKVAETQVAPGTVKQLNVALVLDKSVPAAVAGSIKSTVASAAGVNTKRGDVVSLTQYAFAKPVAPKTGPVPTSLIGPMKWVGLGIASLVFLFFMTRALKRREGEQIARPAWLTEIEEPMSVAELEQRTQVMEAVKPSAGITLPAREPDANLQALDQLMDREPDRVAAQVRQWTSED
jgi:flagellar M-ring protein FliF